MHSPLNPADSFTALIGCFPTMKDFIKFNRVDLYGGVIRNGGIAKFRTLLGYNPILRKWAESDIIIELKTTAEQVGHFPTEKELIRLGKSDLIGAINRYGNMKQFRDLSGFPMSFHEKYRSELASYINIRGHGTEKVVKVLLAEWCRIHNPPALTQNIKLNKGNVIEFVCNLNKRIGIDTTNTKFKETVSRKWKRKDYYKYLDELWVVVFSNVFTHVDFDKWNNESPPNVKVMSIEDFLDELDISVDMCLMNKISNYKKCTFSSKEELKNKRS